MGFWNIYGQLRELPDGSLISKGAADRLNIVDMVRLGAHGIQCVADQFVEDGYLVIKQAERLVICLESEASFVSLN